jgi:hypothetical protein
MTPRLPCLALLPLLLLPGCGRGPAPTSPETATRTAAHTAPQVADRPWRVSAWPLRVDAAAAQPDLIATPDGRLWLSWITGEAGKFALRYAVADRDGGWPRPPQSIAVGEDWFVNWADTPHLAVSADGAVWAHWLQKSAQAPYAYDVVLVRSADGRAPWSAPLKVNTDGGQSEHGFVSIWPDGADAVGVAWLDGRHSNSGEAGHGGHATDSGAMSLRSVLIGAGLHRYDEVELDSMTCDCCQTDAAMTARGPLLVYRDRSEGEVRDIAVARRDRKGWTKPEPVHADGWVMPACPVNGPSVSARGEAALVGWYTAAGDTPKVQAAYSDDAGDRFGAPLVLDRGESVHGRVDTALSADAAWVLWLREERGGQSLQLARLAPDLSRVRQRIEVARLQGRGRGTGFAQMAATDAAVHVVWTDYVGGEAVLRGARVQPEATVVSKGESNIAAGEITGSASGTRSP